MLSKLDAITFKGGGVCVFRVDHFFYAVQVARPGIRHVNFSAGDITMLQHDLRLMERHCTAKFFVGLCYIVLT